MNEILIMILSTMGALFVLSTAIAMLTKPDVYLRINVTTKAATLGLGLILASAAVYFADISVTTRVISIILFIFLTAPIGGHMLMRSAYFTKTPIWSGTKIDELAGQYDPETHELYSEDHDTSIKPEITDKST
ncbi:cation:proton antiporter [Aquiflexum sp.]|uniref:cation:proton antiporter n=1 Tax=Aquiflexum sp. TaxID=1872584 RepID=UPI0035933528